MEQFKCYEIWIPKVQGTSCIVQCDECLKKENNTSKVDIGPDSLEIQPEDIWNEEKKEGIKKAILEHKKEETLEEASRRHDIDSTINPARSFIAGAKWQAERLYSLDEISEKFIGEKHSYFDEWLDYRLNFSGNNPELKKPTFKEWFEQFKKK